MFSSKKLVEIILQSHMVFDSTPVGSRKPNRNNQKVYSRKNLNREI